MDMPLMPNQAGGAREPRRHDGRRKTLGATGVRHWQPLQRGLHQYGKPTQLPAWRVGASVLGIRGDVNKHL
jgi:hypothetical protein